MSTCGTTSRTKPVEAGGRGPKELTGMVDLTRDSEGRVRARLLDLVPGRSGETYKTWLRRARRGVPGPSRDRHLGPVPRVQERDR